MRSPTVAGLSSDNSYFSSDVEATTDNSVNKKKQDGDQNNNFDQEMYDALYLKPDIH